MQSLVSNTYPPDKLNPVKLPDGSLIKPATILTIA